MAGGIEYRGRPALSLVELIIAIMLLTVVLLVGNHIYISARRMQEKSAERSRVQGEAMNAMELMVKGLGQGIDIVYPPMGEAYGGDFGSPLNALTRVLIEKGVIGDTDDDDRLTFRFSTKTGEEYSIEKEVRTYSGGAPGPATSTLITSNSVAKITYLLFSRLAADVGGESNKIKITMRAEDTKNLGVSVNLDTTVTLKGMAIQQ